LIFGVKIANCEEKLLFLKKVNMKRIILSMFVGAILISTTTLGFAQDAKKATDTKAVTKEAKQEPKAEAKPAQPPKMPSYEERADMVIKQMGEKIKDLSPDQKTKLKAFYVKNYKAADADRETYKGDMEKMRESAKARWSKTTEELKGILTKEQWESYTKPANPPQPRPVAPKPEPKKEQPKK
jgi:hypothetical protein